MVTLTCSASYNEKALTNLTNVISPLINLYQSFHYVIISIPVTTT